MNLLWAFELEPAKDDLGLPIPLSANDTTDVSAPLYKERPIQLTR